MDPANHEPDALFAFDVLWYEDEDLRSKPLRERKRTLEKLLRQAGEQLHAVAYIDRGAENYAFPELNHLEGIVAKRVESPYHWPLSALAEDQDAHWAGAGEEEVLPGEVAGTVLYRTGQRYMDPLSVSDILARLGGAVIMVVLIIMIIDDYRSRNRHKE